MPSAMPRRVLLSGVFDMRNYGDLLFPLVARERLAPHGIAVQPVAPTNGLTTLTDAIPPVAFSETMRPGMDADAVLIGGGYVIHTHPMDFLEQYQLGDTGDWAASSLWLGMTLTGALRDIPVLWNAPGVPHPFTPRQLPMVAAAMRAADYVAVRDRGSAELLSAPTDLPVSIVPDPIADLARLWPRKRLEEPFRWLAARKGFPAEARILALHVRDRSLIGLGAEGLAHLIGGFAAARGLTPLLVAVGAAHDDPRIAGEVARHMPQPPVVLDDPESLLEITAAFAHAACYVGASLHGYVAASAYGVPGVLVARPAYRKFTGFLEHVGREGDLARDWPAAFVIGRERAEEEASPRIPPAVHAALDAHWARIVRGISDPARGHAARRDFPAALLRLGMEAAGAGWALRPFLARTSMARHRQKTGQNV